MPTLKDSLPRLYLPLLPPLFDRAVPVEAKATCSACAMCETGAAAVASVDGESHRFRPDTKCCTFHPRLPNYLVGAILSDTDPALADGRARIAERVASGVGVEPHWLRPPATYDLLYRSARRAFGRASSLRCPFYADGGDTGGTCTIWPYRDAVCSTFFCRYVAGEDGLKMWMGVKSYLGLVEHALARWAVLELYPDHALAGGHKRSADTALTVEDLEGAPARDAAATWGPWRGREAEFYQRSTEIVRALDAAALERLLGVDGTIERMHLERLHARATASALPRALQLNPAATVKWLADGTVALGAYSEYDALLLPGEAYALLTAFTGDRTVDETRARLRAERSADLDDELLAQLYRHRVLVEPTRAR